MPLTQRASLALAPSLQVHSSLITLQHTAVFQPPQVTCRFLDLTHFLLPSVILHLDTLTLVLWDSALGLGLPLSETFPHSVHAHPVHITTHIILHWKRLYCPSNGQILATFPPVSPTAERYKVPEGKEKKPEANQPKYNISLKLQISY